MINFILRCLKLLLPAIPLVLFAWLNAKANLKKEFRSKQFPMPFLALISCVLVVWFLKDISDLILNVLNLLPDLIDKLAYKMMEHQGFLHSIGYSLWKLMQAFRVFLRGPGLTYVIFFILNTLVLLAHVIVKRILITIFKKCFKTGNRLYEKTIGFFYELDADTDRWCVKPHCGQARAYLKTFYIASVVISVLVMAAAVDLYRSGLLTAMFYPVFGMILLGEPYFFINGLTKKELHSDLYGEEENGEEVCNYSLLRKTLRKLFGDKLTAENTTVNREETNFCTNESLLSEMEKDEDPRLEAYARYMRVRMESGFRLDQNYLRSGQDLLCGRSILFNNPFYYDLIPYIFYAMNRTLLRHKKVLIVLGRHDTEGDIAQWCREGLTEITNVPTLWNVDVLSDMPRELDVGIVTRSSVHNMKVHEANGEFLGDVEYVVLIEPSRLVTTAQVGLRSLIQGCSREGKQITYCSTDKNCDGLVDALSHILMTSLTEVSATERHRGVSSYMSWETDGEHLQHRMLPNLSRYLGMGTELSFAALKNQVSRTSWYGGEAFPVVDIHWIVKQYYYDLLHYADRPVSQKAIDEYFRVSPNLWNARVEENQYMTVEDEACNMFEVRRNFSTRATEQGFVNVISPDYLLRDYMAENDGIFNADPKAIPYIIADYARTPRNVALRLCLRMSAGPVPEREVRQELMLIDVPAEHVRESLRHVICDCCQGNAAASLDEKNRELLCLMDKDEEVRFSVDTLCIKRKFSMETGVMENQFCILDRRFQRLLLSDLQSAGYIAEDEKGDRQFLGAELRGHVFQKYLPGQFFTFGGKYYEMLTVTSDGQVLVRRAADHITGRPVYRQIRNYWLSSIVSSEKMGDCRDIAGLRVEKQYADIRVETPAYWHLNKYNDFASGKKVTINGVTSRSYTNKQVLRIQLPELDGPVTPEVYSTVALLMNEVFRTLFAENHAFIAAVAPTQGEPEAPLTYSLHCEGGQGENCLYIIEDSQLDMGLLIAVERNLERIFSIICDYLDWHEKTLEESLNPPPAPEAPAPVSETEQGEGAQAEAEPKTRFGRMTKKIKNFFKKIGGFFGKIFKKIGDFFKKLFGKKKKTEEEAPTEAPVTGEELPDSEEMPVNDDLTASEDLDLVDEPEDQRDAVEESRGSEEMAEAGEPQEAEDSPTPAPAEPEEPETSAPREENPEENEMPILMSVGYRRLYSEGPAAPADTEEAPASEEAPAPDGTSGEETEDTENPGDTVEFEPEQEAKPVKEMERKPYHERYYLLFGGTEVPAWMDISGVQALLHGLGFQNSELRQAREGKDIADLIEKNFVPNKAGSHYCDFCGTELVGTEFSVLSDGRERCITCGRTAVKTAAEFEEIYREVNRNLQAFYGIKITAPIHVQMVNAKRLHKRLGKSFVPTGSPDGRVLGVAIKDGSGYSILVENGAPRLQSVMTMAHEMTHIWQYLNWDGKKIRSKYGADQELEVYEGMAKWSEIQYAYLVGETASAKREEIITRSREDEYGRGFLKYSAKYPISQQTRLKGATPFEDRESPL